MLRPNTRDQELFSATSLSFSKLMCFTLPTLLACCIYCRFNATLPLWGNSCQLEEKSPMSVEENSTIARSDCPTGEEYHSLKEAIGLSAEQSGGDTTLI